MTEQTIFLGDLWLSAKDGPAAVALSDVALAAGDRLFLGAGDGSEQAAVAAEYGVDTTDTSVIWSWTEDFALSGAVELLLAEESGEDVVVDSFAGDGVRISYEGNGVGGVFEEGDPFGDVAVREGKPFGSLESFAGIDGVRGEKVYELKEEMRRIGSISLGNVAVVVSDRKWSAGYVLSPEDVEYFVADVVSAMEEIRRIGSISYPYGIACPALAAGVMPGRSFSLGDYRYGFNGKEMDDEWKGMGNHLDFGAGGYDTRLGKFFSVDPKYYLFQGQSSFTFAGNTPIAATDMNGESVYLMVNGTVYNIKDPKLRQIKEAQTFIRTFEFMKDALGHIKDEDFVEFILGLENSKEHDVYISIDVNAENPWPGLTIGEAQRFLGMGGQKGIQLKDNDIWKRRAMKNHQPFEVAFFAFDGLKLKNQRNFSLVCLNNDLFTERATIDVLGWWNGEFEGGANLLQLSDVLWDEFMHVWYTSSLVGAKGSNDQWESEQHAVFYGHLNLWGEDESGKETKDVFDKRPRPNQIENNPWNQGKPYHKFVRATRREINRRKKLRAKDSEN